MLHTALQIRDAKLEPALDDSYNPLQTTLSEGSCIVNFPALNQK